MTAHQTISYAAIITGLLIPVPAIATDVEHNEESSNGYSNEAEISRLIPLEETKVSDVTFVTGGIGSDGVRQMKDIAKNFSLEIVLVEKTEEEEGKEVYIADVNVKINDAQESLVLEVVTDGPFLLVNLPDGQYQVTTEYNSSIKTKRVKVNNKKHARVVFLWSPDSQKE